MTFSANAPTRPPQAVKTKHGIQSAIWEMNDDDRRTAVAKRASMGATRALGRRNYMRIEPTPPPIYPKPQIAVPVNALRWKRILYEVAIEHGIPVALILGQQRNVPVKTARH